MPTLSDENQPNYSANFESFMRRVEAFTALFVEYAAAMELPREESAVKEQDILRRMNDFRNLNPEKLT